MIIQITSRDKTKTFTIRKCFSFDSVKKINDIGTLKISIPIDYPGINNFPIKKGYLINAYFQYSKHDVVCIFTGFISDPVISNATIDIFGYDLMGYAKYRQLRTDMSYTEIPIKTIISELFVHINGFNALPFLLGNNDIDTPITINFAKNTTFYECIGQIFAKKKDMQYRIIHKKVGDIWVNYLDCSIDSGKQIDGSWKDNQLVPQRDTKILQRSWKDSFDGFCNRLVSSTGTAETITEDTISISECGLFEKYEYAPDGTSTELNNSFIGMPTLSVDTDKQPWRDIQVGDKIDVSITSGLVRFAFAYNCIIQETRISANTGGSINFTTKVGPKLIKDTNILNKTLEKFGGIINSLIK